MLAYLLLGARMCLLTGKTVLDKSFQLGFNENIPSFTKYNLINAIFASVFLFALNGFKLNFNVQTLIYSGIFALIVGIEIVMFILALGRTTISTVCIMSTAGSVIISAVFGAVFLRDIPSTRTVIAVILLLASLFFSYTKEQVKKKGSVIIYIIYFLNSGAVNVLTKLYTLDSHVSDEKTFCLLTNLIIAVACIAVTVFFAATKKYSIHELTSPFSLKQTTNICARTVISNIDSLILIWAIKLMDITTFSVATSTFTMISNTLLSVFLFKENLLKKQYAAVLLAIFAIIIGA